MLQDMISQRKSDLGTTEDTELHGVFCTTDYTDWHGLDNDMGTFAPRRTQSYTELFCTTDYTDWHRLDNDMETFAPQRTQSYTEYFAPQRSCGDVACRVLFCTTEDIELHGVICTTDYTDWIMIWRLLHHRLYRLARIG
jgi:hypothetical protein